MTFAIPSNGRKQQQKKVIFHFMNAILVYTILPIVNRLILLWCLCDSEGKSVPDRRLNKLNEYLGARKNAIFIYDIHF